MIIKEKNEMFRILDSTNVNVANVIFPRNQIRYKS